MKIFKSTLRLCILLLIYSCNEESPPFANAKILIQNKDYKGAIEILTKIIEKQPNFDSAYIERAYAHMMLGNIQNSLNDYEDVMSNPSFKISALDGRAFLNFNIGNYQKAIDDYSKIIKLDKNNYEAYNNRGVAKTQLKIYLKYPDTTSQRIVHENDLQFYNDLNEALKDFNKSIEINPKYIDTYVNRGDLLVRQSKFDKALNDYNMAINIDSTCFDAYLQRALLYKQNGDPNKALADFDKAIQLYPESPFPYVNRGYLKREALKDIEGACKDFKKAEELGIQMEEREKIECN